jgi:hypothetical protein
MGLLSGKANVPKTMIARGLSDGFNQRRCTCARDAIFSLSPAKASVWLRFLRQRSRRY